MRRINFNPEYVRLIKNKRKSSTVRKGKRNFKKGEIVELAINNRPFALAKIVECELKTLGEITDEDAKRDGFKSKKFLVKALRQIYGEISPRDRFTIISFEVLKIMD